MKTERIQEYTRRISQANRTEIIAIIYELADDYLADGEAAYGQEDWDGYTEACHAAKKCLSHLLNALDDQYEIAAALTQFYLYQNKEISMACARRDLARLQAVRSQLSQVSESFHGIADQDGSEKMMQNSQTVYAGLTYGRGQLNESYETAGRGFEA